MAQGKKLVEGFQFVISGVAIAAPVIETQPKARLPLVFRLGIPELAPHHKGLDIGSAHFAELVSGLHIVIESR